MERINIGRLITERLRSKRKLIRKENDDNVSTGAFVTCRPTYTNCFPVDKIEGEKETVLGLGLVKKTVTMKGSGSGVGRMEVKFIENRSSRRRRIRARG
jgi:hypothetical protein